jgi:hypothetical protein
VYSTENAVRDEAAVSSGELETVGKTANSGLENLRLFILLRHTCQYA